MFKNEFQGGTYVEVFSYQGKDPLAKWKLTGSSSIHKEYEKEAKGYVHILEGAGTSTRMQLPKDHKNTLALVQQFLVIQVYVPLGHDFSFELGVIDMGNNKRRLLFSTSQRDMTATLHAKIPLAIMKKAVWLNLCLDLSSLVSEAFRGQTFKTLDGIIICASCHLRKIFTMKHQPADSTNDDDDYGCTPLTSDIEVDVIPKNCQFSTDVKFHTQIINMNKLRCAELKLKPDSRPTSSTESDLNASLRGRKDQATHIAFGSKVLKPSSAGKNPTSAGSHRGGGTTCRRPSQSRADKQDEDQTTADRGNSKDDVIALPHPPRQRSGEKSRHIVKVHPKSREKESARHSAGVPDNRSAYDRSRYAANISADLDDSDGSSDSETPLRRSDNDVLKTASSRLTVDIGSCGEPKLTVGKPWDEGFGVSGRTGHESLSESDDAGRLDARMGRTQRRKRRGDRPVSHSETKEAPTGNQHGVTDVSEPNENINELQTKPIDVLTQSNHIRNNSQQTSVDAASEKGNMYIFTSPPRSVPVRPTERRNQLQPKSLKSVKIQENIPSWKNNSRSSQFRQSTSVPDFDWPRSDLGVDSPLPASTPVIEVDSYQTNPQHVAFDQPAVSVSPEPMRKSLLTTDMLESDTLRGSLSSPLTGSLSKMSIHSKKLKEIPKDDPRLSDDYDWRRYMSTSSSVASSLEASMLASLQRQQLEERYEDAGSPPTNKANHSIEEDDLSSSSDDTATAYSTWKPWRGDAHRSHRYEDEMHFPSDSNPLAQSNPRDWSNLFSPPIVLPSEKLKADQLSPGSEFPAGVRTAITEAKSMSSDDHVRVAESEEDEELDLLYDPCLNCYFDPKTCKYYELK